MGVKVEVKMDITRFKIFHFSLLLFKAIVQHEVLNFPFYFHFYFHRYFQILILFKESEATDGREHTLHIVP